MYNRTNTIHHRDLLTTHPASTAHPEASIETQPLQASTIDPSAGPQSTPPLQQQQQPTAPTQEVAPGAAPGPSAFPTTAEPNTPDPTFSPYTFTRQRLRDLTMPPVPNFSLPSAPSPPPPNSEPAALLSQTTKQFERFLALKAQRTHFNSRLAASASLRNPSLLPKLLEFAGIEGLEACGSSLAEGLGVPVGWPGDCFVEGLVGGNERREGRRREKERGRGVEFVAAKTEGKDGVEGGGRRRKFDT